MEISPANWNKRYADKQTGWDIGSISTPLKQYFDQLTDTSLRLLIPGAGNSYEAEYLYSKGFQNVTVLDWSAEAINNFSKRVPGFSKDHVFVGDFFDHQGKYDIIIEQTFFCAINPTLRKAYAEKMSDLLDTNGRLVGVLFNTPLNVDKPPFGGDEKEYLTYFKPLFNIKVFEGCYNSINPRQGKELFINLQKK